MARLAHIRDKYQKDYVDAFPPAGSTVKYKDYFHMKLFYEMLHEWLVEEGWCTREDADFGEDLYLQRENQVSGTELWIWWRLKKKPEGYSSYYRWEIDIDIHVILMKDVEVVRNNMKFKIHNGEPEIKIFARLVVDAKREWRNHWFLKNFHELYKKRILKPDIAIKRRHLYVEAYRLQEMVKTYLKLRTYIPEQEGQQFHLTKDFD